MREEYAQLTRESVSSIVVFFLNLEKFHHRHPLKTNGLEPENTTWEREKHLQTTNFWVPAVSFQGCKSGQMLKFVPIVPKPEWLGPFWGDGT